MANEVLQKHGLQLLFADHATDFGAAPGTANNSLVIGTPTDVQMDTTDVLAAGGARWSTKADLTTPYGSSWALYACTEHIATPTIGETVDFYWAPSAASSALVGNTGSTSGTDAGFTDDAGKLGQMQFIGSLVLAASVINIGFIGILTPVSQYGSLVMVNSSPTKAMHTDAVETHFTLNEIIDEVQ